MIAIALVASCHKPAPHGAHDRDPSVDPRIRIPASISDPRAAQSDRERDVPIEWLYLPEEPVPTGSAPNIIAAAWLPCGFRPVYGSVSPPGVSPMTVRVHAMYQGSGSPAQAHCAERARAIQYVSLQRLRLGNFDVTDGAPRTTADSAAPHVALHVVADDESTPARAVRRARVCTIGDDDSCHGGGVCAEVPGHHVGVCVPPIDPFLDAGHACAEGGLEITLQHPNPYRVTIAPAPGPLRACLPACDANGGCPATLECTGVNGVCVPRG